jgi:hypothetical protein
MYTWCLLQSPLSGPEAGCVRINQTLLGAQWRWGKHRVSRALRWLQTNPSIDHPLLVLVRRGARNQPGLYAIPRFETQENGSRFGAAGATNPPGFVADSVSQVQQIRRFVADSVLPVQRNNNKERAREERELLEQERGVQVFEESEWLTARDEQEATELLLSKRGLGQLPESMQEQAVQTALANLEFYRIRYLDDDDQEAASA